MKYSNYVGILAAILLIGSCFLPWVYIESIKTTISGIHAPHTNFGKPGALHIIFSIMAIGLFLLPAVWAKYVNLAITTFNFAWVIRNFLLITQCELGECPQKLLGIFAILIFSIVMLITATIPRMKAR